MSADKSDRDLIVETNTIVKGIAEAQRDHEKRIRFLEKFAYGISGAWALLTSWFSVHASKH